MNRFFQPLFWILLVFLANVVALSFDIYREFTWLDVPMHFFGGYTVAVLGVVLYGWIREYVEIRVKKHAFSTLASVLLEGMFVLGFVMIISVAWEIWEFLMDQFAPAFVDRFGVTQPGIADTMNDLLNDGIGGLTAWILFRNRS